MLFCATALFAQKKNNHWLLGLTDVNFSNDPPIANTVTGGASSKYGIATISDVNGDLLFYTNGKTVWTKNHQVMQNGAQISLNTEALQETLIVPHPGNSNLYYIFRQEVLIISGGGPYGNSMGFYVYSIVDFSSNSLGQVQVINSNPIQSRGEHNNYTKALLKQDGNALEHSKLYSPLTISTDSSGNNYWVIVQEKDSMFSFKVDSSGLSTNPVVSTFPVNQIYNFGGFDYTAGYYVGIQRSMFRVTSVVGESKLYGLESSMPYNTSDDPAWHTYNFYSLNFNNQTGKFSNFQSIPFNGHGTISYTFELSPDLLKAYFIGYLRPYSTTGINGQIIVKDLTDSSTSSKLLYEAVNTTVQSSNFAYIQKDKYGNMHVSSTSATLNKNKYLHKINNPDSYLNSNIKINNLSLNNNSIDVMPQLFPKLACIESIYLSHTETINKTYRASFNITTNGNYTVNNGVSITLKAGNAIYLEPNTDIKYGAVLIAEIEECSSGNGTTDRVSYDLYQTTEFVEIDDYKLEMYPNPADDIVTLSTTNDQIKNINIVSLDGRIIFTAEVNKEFYNLDVMNYNQGIYIVNINTTKGKSHSKKLIKK